MTGDTFFDAEVAAGLVWCPELGMGYFPVQEAEEPYRNGGAQAYWDKYVGYAATEQGVRLTETRVQMVTEWHDGPVVDIGIGCGSFVEAMHAAGRAAYGCDVNPVAVTWLHHRHLWRSPWEREVAAVTMWDVLEHLPDPALMLRSVREFVFVSLPIFTDAEHIIRSRHFRRDEHRWYWTADGLSRWMLAQGFELVQHDTRESRLGREDIGSFVFRRST